MEEPKHLSPEESYQMLQQAAKKLKAAQRELNNLKEPIAVVGIGCRFPGGANDVDSFWSLLAQGYDAISEVPKERWNIDEYYDPDPEAPGKMYVRSWRFFKRSCGSIRSAVLWDQQ